MIWLSYIAMFLLLMVGILMIFIILLQRGRGGGLAGALGGMGGQSAFGTKAGDMFTRITVVLALIWIVLCAGQIPILRAVGKKYTGGGDANPALKSAPLKEAGAKSKLDLPDNKDEGQADLKAEKDAAVEDDAKSPGVDENKSPDQPADAKSESSATAPAGESEKTSSPDKQP